MARVRGKPKRTANSKARRSERPARDRASPKTDKGVLEWIRENAGKLNEVDILLDLSTEKSALSPSPDTADLGEDGEWVRESGVTPLEFLVRAYRHPLQKPSDRIAAAKAVLDYAHKKTVQMKLEGSLDVNQKTQMTPGDLEKLSDKDLATLMKIYEKMEA
jgi:hypothetical protein